jgi:hypothetical protein
LNGPSSVVADQQLLAGHMHHTSDGCARPDRPKYSSLPADATEHSQRLRRRWPGVSVGLRAIPVVAPGQASGTGDRKRPEACAASYRRQWPRRLKWDRRRLRLPERCLGRGQYQGTSPAQLQVKERAMGDNLSLTPYGDNVTLSIWRR